MEKPQLRPTVLRSSVGHQWRFQPRAYFCLAPAASITNAPSTMPQDQRHYASTPSLGFAVVYHTLVNPAARQQQQPNLVRPSTITLPHLCYSLTTYSSSSQPCSNSQHISPYLLLARIKLRHLHKIRFLLFFLHLFSWS